MPEECVLYDRECIDCGECDMCDLKEGKRCDDCGECIAASGEYITLDVDKFYGEYDKEK